MTGALVVLGVVVALCVIAFVLYHRLEELEPHERRRRMD